MKDKNLILLIGIILIWLLIIRPKTKKEDVTETAESFDQVEETMKTPNYSGYVTQSIKNNNNTVSDTAEVDNFEGRTYTA